MFGILIRNGETWLVCGGRDFTDSATFHDAMQRLTEMWGCPGKLVHGAAKGVDAMAAAWADRMALDVAACPADWDKHGKAAGPIRNEDMLVTHKPNRVIAFPGGKGTADMVRRAKKHGIDVIEIGTPRS